MILSVPMFSPRNAPSLRSQFQLAGCSCSGFDGSSAPKGSLLVRQRTQRLTGAPSLLGVPSLLSERQACNFSHRQHRRRNLHCSAAAVVAASNGATVPTQRLPISRGDFFGGLTSAVVALPLALAFGQASGAGPLAGLYGAIFVGFFAALLGGTPAQVSGPTGPMTVVMTAVLASFKGYPGVALSCIVLGGLLQIAFGFLKLGSFIRLVPLPVISGFMSGVGCIILATQSLAVLGFEPVGSALVALQMLPSAAANANMAALALGALSLSFCLFTPARVKRYLPGSLLALVVGTLSAVVLKLDVPTLGAIPSGLPKLRPLIFPRELLPQIAQSAVMLAVLGSIDSLLTSLVADSLTSTYHDSDKELIGQGVGNTISGLFGGLPGAGATMRTVVNIRSGGRTPAAGALHAVILFGVATGLGSLATKIPLAVLAGILVNSGIDIIDKDYLKRARQLPWDTLLVLGVTWALTVFVDLIAAVAVGCVLSSLIYVNYMAVQQLKNCEILTPSNLHSATGPTNGNRIIGAKEAELLKDSDGLVLIRLRGAFTFNAANGMMQKVVPQIEQHQVSILDLGMVGFVDDTAALTISDMAKRAAQLGRRFYICNANASICEEFEKLKLTDLFIEQPTLTLLETLRQAQSASSSRQDDIAPATGSDYSNGQMSTLQQQPA